MTLNTLCWSKIDWIYRIIVGQIDRFAFRWSSFERESVLVSYRKTSVSSQYKTEYFGQSIWNDRVTDHQMI